MSNSLDLQSIRPLRRSDLEVVCRKPEDVTLDEEWIVKDPVQLNYFFLDRVQHWLFQRLNGSFSLKETQQAFSQSFAGAKISEQQLLNFCMRLGRDGLLCETASGETLARRQRQKSRIGLYKLPLSLLAIRLPGLNVGPVIRVVELLFGWVFSPLAVLLAMIWLALASAFGIQLLDEIAWSLPSLSNVRFADVIMLLACVSIVKIIHELAHAVCCRRMGAKCKEIGMMFLVFSPCLYCNVTDSWMLPEKWKRIAIAAAGIYIELLIASTSLFLWHFAETAFLKSLFLNLMIVCTVSTLLINGNPLMRYDGYFIFSDLIGVPNLSQQARSRTWDWVAKPFFVFRQSIGSQNQTANSAVLIAYHLASVAYRVFILTVIFLVFYALLEPVGLQNVAGMLAFIYVASLLTSFCLAFIPMLRNRNQQGRQNWAAIVLLLLSISAAGYFIANVNVPRSINASARIEFNELATCTAKTSGQLEWAIDAGASIGEGELVARLSSFEAAQEEAELGNRIELAKLKIENLKSLSVFDPDSRIALPSAESELAALTEELKMFQRRKKELEIVAPAAGIVIESFKQSESNDSQITLAKWNGSALDGINRDCTIEQGETICLINKRYDWKVLLLVNEQKRDLISGGERVALRTSLERDRLYGASVGKLFDDAIEEDSFGQRQFRIELVLDEPISIGFHGAVGKASITIEERTLWEACKRYVMESFRFEL